MKRLERKVSIVTGGGSGLGEATSIVLARAGMRVAVVDLREEGCGRVADSIRDQGGDALALCGDVSDEATVHKVVQQVLGRWDRIDAMINNAAVDHTLSVHEMTVAQWDQVLAVNLRGPFLFAKAVWPVMMAQHGGHIVNIASTAAKRAWANAAAYHTSKWGLLGFSRGLGVEGRPHNIKVTAIVPGGMRTHFFDRFGEQGIPLPDPAKLQDPMCVAELIAFVVSMPPESVLQEAIITPLWETSWP